MPTDLRPAREVAEELLRGRDNDWGEEDVDWAAGLIERRDEAVMRDTVETCSRLLCAFCRGEHRVGPDENVPHVPLYWPLDVQMPFEPGWYHSEEPGRRYWPCKAARLRALLAPSGGSGE